MNKLTRTSLIHKFAGFLGIAGVSSLISLPGLAEINPQAHISNRPASTSFELAETPATDSYGPRSNPNDPTKTNAPSAGSSYPENYPSGGTRPNSDASPSSTPDAPSSDASDSSTTNAPSSNPNDPTTTNAPSAGSSYPSNYPSNTQAPSGGSSNSSPGNSQNSLSSKDKNFINQAAQINMAEIQLGQLALQRGSSNAVKQYAQRMINEHTQASQQLMQLASQKGVTPPTSLDSQHKATMDRLSKLSGASFDEAYMKEMVNGHNQALSLFQTESKEGTDADVKAWANRLIPNLQAHLQMANQNAAKR